MFTACSTVMKFDICTRAHTSTVTVCDNYIPGTKRGETPLSDRGALQLLPETVCTPHFLLAETVFPAATRVQKIPFLSKEGECIVTG